MPVMTTSYRDFWEPRVNNSSWAHFRRTYWGAHGRALFKDLLEKPPLERFLHVEQPVVRDAFSMNGTGDAVFIREEFLLFAERARNARNVSSLSGVLLLGQPGIGKSLFLLFFLVQCLAREEPVQFTSRFGNTYLFDKDGVAKTATTNFDPTICLPSTVDGTPRLLSLVDWPSTKALPYSVACCLTTLFSVIDPSSDPACYQKLRREAKFLCWWMSPWSPEELHALYVSPCSTLIPSD
ncbi:hypothetical protein LXA43DRAFT_1036606 [Ganoderma leucocontextum]|nr:hypothetical protein LXA43DRAFT_1036606 [Ganoderma leucocontextum]